MHCRQQYCQNEPLIECRLIKPRNRGSGVRIPPAAPFTLKNVGLSTDVFERHRTRLKVEVFGSKSSIHPCSCIDVTPVDFIRPPRLVFSSRRRQRSIEDFLDSIEGDVVYRFAPRREVALKWLIFRNKGTPNHVKGISHFSLKYPPMSMGITM